MTRTVLLDDILYPVSDTMKFTSNPVIFLNTSDIEAGKFLHSNLSDPKQLPGQAKKQIKQNDILFSEIRPANKRYAYVDFHNTENYVVSTKLMVLRSKEGVHPRFAYHWLTASKQLSEFQVIAESRSGTFPQITFDTIKNLELTLPDYDEQVLITDFIDKIDEKIELNRRMNESLEQMGQALFKKYFIDNPEAEKWEVKSLDDIANFLNGLAMQKYPYVEGQPSLPVIKIREMSSGITSNTDIASANIPEKYIVKNGDLLFSWSGTLLVKFWSEGEGALNQHLFKVSSEEYPEWLYYYWTKFYHEDFIQTAKSKATTMGHIQRGHIKAAKVRIPDEEIMRKIGKEIQPLIDSFKINSEQIQSFISLSDSLLPKLISGKIEID